MRSVNREKEPFWKSAARVRRASIPGNLDKWLFGKSSLTSRLIKASDGQFSIEVESEKRGLPQRNERMALGLRHGEYVFARQVYLICKGKPWVFARSVIPVKTANGPLRGLTRLGNKSLGSVLFSDPNIQRSALALTRVSNPQKCFDIATKLSQRKASEIWGRRSKFTVRKHPLLVSEFFLPDLPLPNITNNTQGSENTGTKSEKSSFWDIVSGIFGGNKEKSLSH